jgi:hypothetical protein
VEEPSELFDGEDLAGTFVFEEGGVVVEDATVAQCRCGGVAGREVRALMGLHFRMAGSVQ